MTNNLVLLFQILFYKVVIINLSSQEEQKKNIFFPNFAYLFYIFLPTPKYHKKTRLQTNKHFTTYIQLIFYFIYYYANELKICTKSAQNRYII